MKSLVKSAILLLTCCSLCSCAAVHQPVTMAFADGKASVLMRPLNYDIPAANMKGTIPAGFVTDFASIPSPLWSALPPNERYGPIAVVHDYLYWSQPCTREQADVTFLEGMKESGIPKLKREAIYKVVRLAGGSAWNSNARERAAGLPKFVPMDKVDDIPATMTWPEYRATLPRQK